MPSNECTVVTEIGISSNSDNSFVQLLCYNLWSIIMVGRIAPAAPVLAGPGFSQGKSKIPFMQKARYKQSASMISGIIRLIILSYNR